MGIKTIKTTTFQRLGKRLSAANTQLSFYSAILLMLFVTADQTYQAHERRFMISEIQMTALVTGLHTGLYKVDGRVLNAMARVPREQFLDQKFAQLAFKNVALPMTGEKHIIPEPFLTAMMIHLMGVNKHDKVLEIGYGTGYETAVLSKLARRVYSIHQENPLGKSIVAQSHKQLGAYPNVKTKIANGLFGWQGEGKFDSILVKQVVYEPPHALLNQLKPYGRLVVPIENEHGEQRVFVYLKLPDGSIQRRQTLFVKMTPLLPGQDI